MGYFAGVRRYAHEVFCDVSPAAFGQSVVDFGSSLIVSSVSSGVHNPYIEGGLFTIASLSGLHAVGRAALSGMALLEQ